MKKIIVCILLCLSFLGCAQANNKEHIGKTEVYINNVYTEDTVTQVYINNNVMPNINTYYYIDYTYEGITRKFECSSSQYSYCKKHIGEKMIFDLTKLVYEDGNEKIIVNNIYEK